MPRGLPRNVQDNLDKAKASMRTAVEVYNKPGGCSFRTAHYLVLAVVGWTALIHAIFYRRKKKPWYVKPTKTKRKRVRYEYIDGEPKHWDLSKCLTEYFGGESPPERRNLEFLLGLRNKIEHRSFPELDPALYGECQAALMNFDELLSATFGEEHALTDTLAVSLQFARSTPDGKAAALKRLASTRTKDVREYVEQFRGGLPADVLESSKYSFSVFLVPKVANRASAGDICVEFVPFDGSPEGREELQKVNAVIREKQVPVLNLNTLKPSQVVKEVKKKCPHRMTPHIHTLCWKHFQVRPSSSSKNPEKTDAKYCLYDKVHADYVYTEAWVALLCRELSDADKYEEITGKAP